MARLCSPGECNPGEQGSSQSSAIIAEGELGAQGNCWVCLAEKSFLFEQKCPCSLHSSSFVFGEREQVLMKK